MLQYGMTFLFRIREQIKCVKNNLKIILRNSVFLLTHKTIQQLLIATKTYTSPVSKRSDNRIVSYCGKPDFSKNHIFEKISEIHFSSDCKNFNRYESRIPKSIDNSNLKVLARIIKKFKILITFKNF